MLQIARMTGNKKAGAACAQQAAPTWDKYPLYLMAASRERIPLAACQIRS